MATREDRITSTLAAVLLLIVGYALGYWSASATPEVPLVFQSASGEGRGETGVLTEEDLRALTAPASASPVGGTSGVVHGTQTQQGAFVASVNGSKYYTTDCSEVRRISEQNRIWFESEEEARSAGYERSACLERQQ